MKADTYNDFAIDWVSAWNADDLESIIAHYSENIEFTSPVIQQLGVNEQGLITSKSELKRFLEKVCKSTQTLHLSCYIS